MGLLVGVEAFFSHHVPEVDQELTADIRQASGEILGIAQAGIVFRPVIPIVDVETFVSHLCSAEETQIVPEYYFFRLAAKKKAWWRF